VHPPGGAEAAGELTVAVAPGWQAAILAAVTLAVFLPTLSSGFVYDARLQILTDPFLHDPWNWLPVLSFGVLGMDVLDFNRPVQLASLMIDAAIWGRDPFGYHLTSVLLHALNVVLVWRIASDVLHGGPSDGETQRSAPALAALLAALLFAVHPVVTEAVCEPTFREDLLAAAFTLGALVLAADRGAAQAGVPWRAVGCAACCLLAVASKESGVAAPFLLAGQWWLRGGCERSRFWGVAIAGGFMLVGGFLVARFLLETTPSRIFESRPVYPGGSLAAALLLEPRILALYAQLVVLPVNLCADYGIQSVRHLPLWAAAIVLGVLALAGWLAARRDRRVLLGIALVVLPLLPVSNLVPIYRAAADRYLYLPLAGAACIVGCLLDRALASGNEQRRQVALVAALAAVVLLATACVGRQSVWASPLALWENTFSRNPESFTAASGASSARRMAGRTDEAIVAARRSVEISRGARGDAWLTLALAYDAAGRVGDADAAARKAVELDPRLADPDARVAAIAMERDEAEAAKTVLARVR
jgi:protein O-mannosyl-transferase